MLRQGRLREIDGNRRLGGRTRLCGQKGAVRGRRHLRQKSRPAPRNGRGHTFNWYDAAKGNCKKKDAVYDTLYKGVSLLPAPKSTEELTYDEFYELILSFESSYDYILFDAENCGTAFDFAAKICDKAIIVTTPDAVSLRSAFDKAEK